MSGDAESEGGPSVDRFGSAGHRPIDVEVKARAVRQQTESGTERVLTFYDIGERLAVARQANQLATVQARETEHRRVLSILERALRPDLPRIDGWESDLEHRPADSGAPTGGDLVDVHWEADRTLVVVLTDVAGKGVEATRAALNMVHTATAIMAAGGSLGSVVADVDHALDQADDSAATMAVAELDLRHGRVSVACGGHPPPLVVRADGSTEFMDSIGRAVGYPMAGTDNVVSTYLDRGDLLLLYTDGLIEGDGDIVKGLAMVEHHARLLRHRPIDGWCARLADHVLHDAPRRDDLLAVALRRTPRG